jgi:TPR repeat protein
MYGRGLGTPQDFQATISWYLKAAEQGHAKAQNNLGFMYLKGQGVSIDLVQACKWFALSAASGNEDARANQMICRQRMTSDQIARADDFVDLVCGPVCCPTCCRAAWSSRGVRQ